MALKRDDICRVLQSCLPADGLVIAGLGTAGRAWRDVGAPQSTYYASDPMGSGIMMALGLALARPNNLVLYLGGDGDLVMSLGALMTIAGAAANNFKIAIFDNGRYETGGGQPLPAAERTSLPAVARGCGFDRVDEIRSEDEAAAKAKAFFALPGLAFLALHVAMEASPYGPPPRWSQAEDRAVFMRRLAGDL